MLAPAANEPEGIRLIWLDINRIYAGASLPVVLGRSPQATYIIDDNRVSRSHARIDWHGGTFQLTDLSYNGTYVRFDHDPEMISLRRGACTLHGSGVIGLGTPPIEPLSPSVRFEMMRFADTQRSRRPRTVRGGHDSMSFAAEPEYQHGCPVATAVVLCNLGTPDEPTPPRCADTWPSSSATRGWSRFRAGLVASARRHPARPPGALGTQVRHDLDADGSPLKTWTEKQATMLGGYLGERGHRVAGAPCDALRVPSVASRARRGQGRRRHPRADPAALSAVFRPDHGERVRRRRRVGATVRAVPEMRFVNRYHDDAGYIGALARRVTDHWQTHGRGERLVLSFHGVPSGP